MLTLPVNVILIITGTSLVLCSVNFAEFTIDRTVRWCSVTDVTFRFKQQRYVEYIRHKKTQIFKMSIWSDFDRASSL